MTGVLWAEKHVSRGEIARWTSSGHLGRSFLISNDRPVPDSAAESRPNAKARYCTYLRQPSQGGRHLGLAFIEPTAKRGFLGAVKTTLNTGSNTGGMVPAPSDNIRPW